MSLEAIPCSKSHGQDSAIDPPSPLALVLIQSRMNTSHIYFDHEKLVAYQLSIQFVVWANNLLEKVPKCQSDPTKRAFACLHRLIQAVGRECGRLAKGLALLTSAVVLLSARWTAGP